MIAVFVLAAAGGAASADTRPWVEARSANFVVVSDAGAKEARRIAARFEQIRGVFHSVWPTARLGTGEPIVILGAKNEGSLKELLPEYWEKKGAKRIAGVFFRSPERQYVALRTDLGDEVQGMNPYLLLYRAYVHALLDLNFESMPVWLGEGLADFWGNTIVRDDAISQGKPFAHHVQVLRERGIMPLRVLLKVDHQSPEYNEETRASVFYAQSWALVHLLLTDGTSAGAKQLNAFLALRGQGVPEDDALVRAFGDLTRLEKELDRYIRQYAFRYSVRKGDFAAKDEAIAVRSLSPAESLAVRGAFMAQRDRKQEARALLDDALSLDPSLAVAHEGRGFLAWREGRNDDARAAFAQAAALDSKSALTHFLYGTLLLEGPDDAKSLEAAAAAFQRSVDLNHDSAPAYAMLAQTLARTGTPPELALPLARRAVSLEPATASHRLTVARLLIEAGKAEDARKEIARALALAKSYAERAYAGRLLDWANEKEAAPVNGGKGLAVDPASAAKQYQQACDRGDGAGCFNLAEKQASGFGVVKDTAAAAKNYRKACDAGYRPACAKAGPK